MMTGYPLLDGLPTDVPVDPDSDQARQWAIDELSKEPYQSAKPGILDSIWDAIVKFFNSLLEGLQNATGIDGGVLGIVLVIVVIGLIVGLVLLLRPRLLHREQPDAEVFESALTLSAAQHRTLATKAADVRDFALAITETFRAIVRASEERGVIDPQAGRTADEVAGKLSAAFGSARQALLSSAILFNRVRYSVQSSGRSSASESEFRAIRELDESLASLRPEYSDEAQLNWVGPQ